MAKKSGKTSVAKTPDGKKKETSAIEKARRINATAPKREKGSFVKYWKGVRREMGKVVWPTRKELVTYTAVVLVTCAVFAIGFWLIDTGTLAVLKHVLGVALS
jgi:preprotein translocase subunit SecE